MKFLNKLGLGTVQWGIPYGVANQGGITSAEEVAALLGEARDNGIGVLDTASQYGDAEAVLGHQSLSRFNVITKTPSFLTDCISDQDSQKLVVTFMRSLEFLKLKKIYGLMIHQAQDLLTPGGTKLLAAMNQLKEKGLVEKIGVSVYDTMQINAVLKIFTPDLIQVPLSVIDQRLLINGCLEELKSKGVEIHARSVLLQGLLLMPLDKIPLFFEPILPLLALWHSAAHEQGLTLNQAALSFVRDIECIDTVLIGVDNIKQLRMCINDFLLNSHFDATGLACNNPLFVNPSLWRLT